MSRAFPFLYQPEMPPYVLPVYLERRIYGPSVASPNIADPTIFRIRSSVSFRVLLELIYRVSSDPFQPLVMISSAIEELSSVLLHVIRNNEYFQFEPAVQEYAHPPVCSSTCARWRDTCALKGPEMNGSSIKSLYPGILVSMSSLVECSDPRNK